MIEVVGGASGSQEFLAAPHKCAAYDAGITPAEGPGMIVDELLQRLRELAQRTAETPLYNPVFQLSHEISRKLEQGDIRLDEVARWVDELYAASLDSRAARLARLLADEGKPEPAPDFAAFQL